MSQATQVPDEPWPTNIFPKSFTWDKSPNMLEIALDLKGSYQAGFFIEKMNLFTEALAQRKSTGKGLTFQNQEHLQHSQKVFSELDEMSRNVILLFQRSQALFNKFSGQFNSLYLYLMGRKNKPLEESRTLDIQSPEAQRYFSQIQGVKIAFSEVSGTLGDNFVRLKLLYDASFEIYADSLNAWGNLATAYALNFEELGDGSLKSKIPEVSSIQ